MRCLQNRIMFGLVLSIISSLTCRATENGPDSLVQSAKDAYEHKNYELAVSLLTEAIKFNPTAESLCARASARFQLGDCHGAIIDCDSVLNSDPDPEYLDVSRITRAECFISTGDYNRAIADCTATIERNPNCKEAWFARASIWFTLGNDKLAMSDLDHLVQMAPDYFDAYVLRSQCYQSKNEWANAIADIDKAIRSNDKESDWFVIRGFAHIGSKAYKDALADFQQAARLNESNSIATVAECIILVACPQTDLRDPPLAIKLAKKMCANTESNDCLRLSFLASIYAQEADFPNAVLWQQKAVDIATLERKQIATDRLILFKSGKPLFIASKTDFDVIIKNWR
ncbi:MAG TPA: tetratricopeptide repeat protein [Lacipirellulaceae bacterium]|jgi:tetratricopeptide (TPR) repeat protein|nr:tetratricopeptide repeat protein [Lacipirellulaceae bacterium]